MGNALRVGYELFSPRERKEGLLLIIAIAFSAVIDMASIMSIMPLVTLIVEPVSLTASSTFQSLLETLGQPELDDLIVWLAVLVGGLLTLSAVINLGLLYWLNAFGSRAASRLARDMMRECLAAPYAWHLTQNAAVLTRMFFGDIQRWGSDFGQRILMVTHKVVIMLLAAAIVFYAALVPGVIALSVVGGLTALLLAVARPAIASLADVQRARSDAIVSMATQCFAGIKDIKLSSRENSFTNLYADAFWIFSWTRMMLAIWQQVPPIVMLFLGQISLVMVAVILWKLELPAGEIAASMALLVLVSARLVPALNRISGDFTAFWNVFPYIERLGLLRASMLTEQDEGPDESATGTPALQWSTVALRDIGYGYAAEERAALSAVNLSIESGMAYGIAGPSGAGKSTLVDILLGLLEASSGQVLVDGRELRSVGTRQWQKGIGYVPQQPFIADDTVRANVAFGVPHDAIDDDHVWACLERANISTFCAELSNGLDTILGDQGKRLSGGQRQRIAIARAFYNEPSLLVLDEATSALDSVSEAAIKRTISELQGRITTITVAHRLTTIRDCDAIFLLDNGRLVDTGRYEELLSRNVLFHNLVHATAPTSKDVHERMSAAI